MHKAILRIVFSIIIAAVITNLYPIKQSQAAMSLESFNRLSEDEEGRAAIRWYLTGMRDSLTMFEDYERTVNSLTGTGNATAQSLYCISDDIELTTELLWSFIDLQIERRKPETYIYTSIPNVLIEELSHTFPCDEEPQEAAPQEIPTIIWEGE